MRIGTQLDNVVYSHRENVGIGNLLQERQNVLNECNTFNFEAVPVMYWIKYTTLDIPDFIKVNPCTIDKNGESCMFYWIKYRKGIEVPEFIRHDPLLIRNNDNVTAAMLWIKTNGTEPPSYLIHNPYAIDKFGENLAMYWIKYAKNPLQVPESLLSFVCSIVTSGGVLSILK